MPRLHQALGQELSKGAKADNADLETAFRLRPLPLLRVLAAQVRLSVKGEGGVQGEHPQQRAAAATAAAAGDPPDAWGTGREGGEGVEAGAGSVVGRAASSMAALSTVHHNR